MSVFNCQECQENEFLAISSMYPNEVKDLRNPKKVWGKWVPLEIEIRIDPEVSTSENKDNNPRVYLYIRCSNTYPETVPSIISIERHKGISDEDALKLKAELAAKAEELSGKEALMDLVLHARTFLYRHKKPLYESFFHEMESNRTKKEQEKAEKLKKQEEECKVREEQTLLAIEQEKLRKLELLKDANRKTRFSEDCNPEGHIRKPSVPRQRSRSTSVGKETFQCDSELQAECKEMLNSKLKFIGKKEVVVTCGRCLSHNERGCVTYTGMDANSGNPVILIKWTLQFNANHKLKGNEWEALQKEQSTYQKQIATIEQEFKALRQLDFKHLVCYIGMSSFTKKDKITIYVLQEFVPGCTLAHFCTTLHLTTAQLQHYTRNILEALKYLHDNSIVHKNLRPSSLFVDNNGVMKLNDSCLDKKLYDLYRTHSKEEEIDNFPITIGKGGRKSDIYRFGVVLLSLVAGQLSKTTPVNIPDDLNLTFKDFLTKCLQHDEQDRWSAEQLLSHPFLAQHSLMGIQPPEDDISDDFADDSLSPSISEVIQGSRLHKEFDVLKVLGKGSFGHVWKVKNKLDSRVYALKRIALNPKSKHLNRKIKREVKLLSRLNHENIVRYYNSWIEATPESDYADKSREVTMTEINGFDKTESSIQWKINDKDFSSSEEENDDDDFIVFEDEIAPVKITNTDSSSSFEHITMDAEVIASRCRQFMYIQMQFCEKSTLRTAIDNGLHKDRCLMWRLFREIVEGLHYIHQQGVIHRDLKPVNIFLDSNDHVKIGDFGLATDVISKPMANGCLFSDHDPTSKSDTDDGTQTGRVGTIFYVAPELSVMDKVCYTQKVDIYSLGVIFFEMCYPPLATEMERHIILSNLRKPAISFPTNATDVLTEEMIQIAKWLLQHDAVKRPSSNELITSKHIPPLLMEESELNNLLNNTISNPQSRMYKHMISALFDQKVSPEFDFTYDVDVFRSQRFSSKPSQLFGSVVDALNRIMKLHGAIYFTVPTLMPKSLVIYNEFGVQVMEHGGGMVLLPYNLRIPFARYIARREIENLKRYSLEKVYRQQRVFGCHPREHYEFAFDIVTPTPNSFLPDAEIIATISEIISEFPCLENRNYYIRLNHASLVKAIFLYSEIEESIELDLYEMAGEQKEKTITKTLLTDGCSNIEISQRSITRLCQFMDVEDSLEKVKNLLHPVLQKKGRACSLARNSLKELEKIVSLTQALGVKLPIVICPGLTHNISLFSGMFFHCVCKLKSTKKKNILDVLAAGGRYDSLIQSFKLKTLESGKAVSQSAVGASLAIENIIAAEMESGDSQDISIADCLIHSEGSGMSSEKAALMKELQDLGIRATVVCDKTVTLADAQVCCRIQGIQYLLIVLKEEPGYIKIRSVDRDKVNEKKIHQAEIKDILPKMCSKNVSDLKLESSRHPSFSTSTHSINVRFLPPDKNNTNKKRQQKITSHVVSTLQILSSRTWELIPVDMKMLVINCIVSYCDIAAKKDAIQRSFDHVIDEHTKHKRYLTQLFEEICDIRSKKPNCAIVLYSLQDNNFRVLL